MLVKAILSLNISGSTVEIGLVLGSYKVPAGIEISKEQVLVMHLAIEGTYQ